MRTEAWRLPHAVGLVPGGDDPQAQEGEVARAFRHHKAAGLLIICENEDPAMVRLTWTWPAAPSSHRKPALMQIGQLNG